MAISSCAVPKSALTSQHLDGYSFYPPSTDYPNGSKNNTEAERKNLLKLVKANYRITGREAPDEWPLAVCTSY